jgi:hypothetical protein
MNRRNLLLASAYAAADGLGGGRRPGPHTEQLTRAKRVGPVWAPDEADGYVLG